MKKLIFVLLIFLTGVIFAQNLFILDFESETIGSFPAGWTSREKDDMAKVYRIQAEEGNKFLRGDAKGLSITIAFRKKWELADYPLVSWRWRAIFLPTGSNERIKSGNDDVLGMHVIFGGWPIPKVIKYIWSETLPAGTELESPFSSKTKMVVLRSGKSQLGEWIYEERDVLADYQRLFGDNIKPTARGIAILTDSDNTKSEAVGDYDDITISVKKN